MWCKQVWLLCLPLIAVLIGTADVLQAQERFGAITGVVKDESGGVLPGVTVIIVNGVTGRTATVVTDGAGVYNEDDLDPGRYNVRFELGGFARSEVPDITVLLGRTLEVNAVLKVGNISEAVQVTAEAAPLIDLRTTTVAHNITAEELELLPKTRSFQSMALTAPSVNTGEIEGGFQVNGASGAENAFTIDGVVTNSLINGRSRQDTVFEYLQEVQVKTTGIPAEYGGAMGGVISAVTKSGGNTVRGEAHYYYEGSKIGASPVRRLVLNPVDDKTVSYVQDDKQPDNRNEFGGSVGGPIIKDKLFFFGSASPRLVRRNYTYLFGNGATQGVIGQKQTLTQSFGKISYAGARINAHATVLYTPTRSTGTQPPYNGAAPNYISSSQAGNAANVGRGFRIDETSATGNVDVMLSNGSSLSFRGGYFRDNYADTGISSTTSVIYQTSSVGLAGVPAGLQGPIGTQNTPRAMITSYDTARRQFVSADYNHTFSAAGWHSLKGGIGFQQTVSEVSASYPGGYVFLYWNRDFVYQGNRGRGTYGYYEVNDRGIQGTAGTDMVSLYLQDQWAVSDRLTLGLGVRTETEKIPTYRPDLKKYGLQFGFGERIAPRLGVSYDVTGNGRVKVYGSWGRYVDWTKYELPRDSFGSDVWRINYRALDTLDVYSFSLDNMPGTNLWIVPNSFRDQRVPNFDRVDPQTKPTYQDSTSVGLEYQLGKTCVLTVHYVHNDLKRVIDDVGTVVNGNAMLYIANPGEGNATIMATTGLTSPFATPKPKRLYDAIEIGVGRRFSKNWFASANYTYSRLYGNYGGLASSDEIRTPTTGASYKTHQQQSGSIANPGGSVNNLWNIDELMWDSHGTLDVVGRLATDRPHVVKLYGAYSFPFGTELGVFFYGGSGTPISTYVNTTNQTEVFVNGRGDMGRTPVLTNTNVLLAHSFGFAGSRKLRVELNVLNVFNQKTTRHLFNWLNRGAGTARASSSIDLTRTNLANGYDYNSLIMATPDGANAYDPRYGKADLFSDGAQGQLTIKFLF